MTHFSAPLSRLVLITGLLASHAAMAQICTREYAPVCGQVEGALVPQTFPNRCMLEAAKATPLNSSECPDVKPLHRPGSDVDPHGCKPSAGYQWNDELGSCVRPWMSSTVTLQVASKRRHCTGVIEMQCLQVRELIPGKAPQKWVPFFGEITGFKHVPGKRYTLRVRKDKLENPPADAPNTRYTLLKILP